MVVSETLDTNMTFARPKRQKTPTPRTNYAVKYATARGHLYSDYISLSLIVSHFLSFSFILSIPFVTKSLLI